MSVMLGNRECCCKAAEEWQKCVGKCLGNAFRPFSFKHCLFGIPLEIAFCHVLTNLSVILLLEFVIAVWMHPKHLVRMLFLFVN